MKLLVVDDSKIMRSNIIALATKIKGIEIVGEASDGIEAIAVFEATRPHIVTMDLTMPRLNGVETIKKLIKLDPSVRILVISSLNDIDTALSAIENGAKGFLQKPFSQEELKDKIINLI